MTNNKETNDNSAQTTQSPWPQVVRSPLFRSVYSNNYGFNLNSTDFSILFASNASIPGIPMIVPQEEVSVTMPFAALKILAETLPQIVKGIEEKFGPILIPRGARDSTQVEALMANIRNHDFVK